MGAGIPSFLTGRPVAAPPAAPSGRVRRSIAARGAEHAASVLRAGFIQWDTARRRGFFQGLDARVKVVFLVAFVVLVSAKRTLLSGGGAALLLFALAAGSRIELGAHYRRIALLTVLFGFLLGLPSALNLITPGRVVLPVAHFGESRALGPWTVPREVGFTAEGLRHVALLSLRVMNSLAVSLLVFATTPFTEFVRALRVFRVPGIFLLTLTLAYRYIFIFTTTVYDMHLAKKSRLAGPEQGREARRWVAGRIAFLFQKSQQRCEEVFRAMLARGLADTFRGRAFSPLSLHDRLSAAGLLLAGIALWGL
jgi:cobalt ECF transporter T component CbiQ